MVDHALALPVALILAVEEDVKTGLSCGLQ